MSDLIPIEYNIKNMVLRKIAYFSVGHAGNDIYFAIESILILVNYLGMEKVEEMLKKDNSTNKERNNKLGKEFTQFWTKLKKLNKYINKAKGYYDKLDDKRFVDLKENQELDYFKAIKKVSLIQEEIYTLFIFLIVNTDLLKAYMRSEWFKIPEHTNLQKLKVTDKKPDLIKTEEKTE